MKIPFGFGLEDGSAARLAAVLCIGGKIDSSPLVGGAKWQARLCLKKFVFWRGGLEAGKRFCDCIASFDKNSLWIRFGRWVGGAK
jgi:hypothetical protein